MKYNIKLVSLTNSIFTLAALFAIFIPVIASIIPKLHRHIIFAFPITIIPITIGYFVWQKFVTGKTEWTITNDEISMEWVKQFAFTKRDGLNLKLEEVEYCQLFSERYYVLFKIKLIIGDTYRFYIGSALRNDDQYKFYDELKKHLGHAKIPLY
jgi:hypothetical protein